MTDHPSTLFKERFNPHEAFKKERLKMQYCKHRKIVNTGRLKTKILCGNRKAEAVT